MQPEQAELEPASTKQLPQVEKTDDGSITGGTGFFEFYRSHTGGKSSGLLDSLRAQIREIRHRATQGLYWDANRP